MNKIMTVGLTCLALSLGAFMSCSKPGSDPDIPKPKPGPGPSPEPEPKVITHKNFLIEELYYTGTWISKGKFGFYDKDQYLKITNPTDEVLYLDGLGLAVTHFQSTEKIELPDAENFISTHVNIGSLVQFPGDGKTYKVDPHKSVIVCGYAVNHQKEGDYKNPTSVDLSTAGFEWLTKEQIESNEYPENEQAVHLKPIYIREDFDELGEFDLGKGSTILLVKLPKSPSEELKKQDYQWKYRAPSQNGHHHKDGACLKLPNDSVIDAVSLCPQDLFKWSVVAPTLDKGHTSVKENSGSSNQETSGKSVARRNNNRQLEDTNNSTLDFEPQRASLLPKK